MSVQNIQELVQILHKGNKKETCDYIKKILSENVITDTNKRLAWQGWLAGLESSDPSAIINQLIMGVEKKHLKNIGSELKAMNEIVERQDPPRHASKDVYFREWNRLVREYKKGPKEPETTNNESQ